MRYGKLLLALMILLSCLTCATAPGASGNKNANRDFSSKLVGTWKVFAEVPRGDFSRPASEFVFRPDGTMVENVDDPNNPGVSKWSVVENNIFSLQIGGKVSYMMVENYEQPGFPHQSRNPENYKKMRSLKGNYYQYPEGSPYYQHLYIFYFAPGDQVDRMRRNFSRRDAIVNSIRDGMVVVRDYDKLMAVFSKQQKEQQEQDRLAGVEFEKRIRGFERRWGKKVAKAIENQEVFVGMTGEQVVESLSEPSNKNTVDNASGRFEQWVYPDNRYLYFRNNRLHTIQKSSSE